MNINNSEECEIQIGILLSTCLLLRFVQCFLRPKWPHTAVTGWGYKSRTKVLHPLTTRCIVLHRQM
jgi:hypothetical protein